MIRCKILQILLTSLCDYASEESDVVWYKISTPSLPCQIQHKISEVQQELQELKARLDAEMAASSSSSDEYVTAQHTLSLRVEQLKEEFRELLVELRRRKASDGALLSDDVRPHPAPTSVYAINMVYVFAFRLW